MMTVVAHNIEKFGIYWNSDFIPAGWVVKWDITCNNSSELRKLEFSAEMANKIVSGELHSVWRTFWWLVSTEYLYIFVVLFSLWVKSSSAFIKIFNNAYYYILKLIVTWNHKTMVYLNK